MRCFAALCRSIIREQKLVTKGVPNEGDVHELTVVIVGFWMT